MDWAQYYFDCQYHVIGSRLFTVHIADPCHYIMTDCCQLPKFGHVSSGLYMHEQSNLGSLIRPHWAPHPLDYYVPRFSTRRPLYQVIMLHFAIAISTAFTLYYESVFHSLTFLVADTVNAQV